MKRVQIRTTIFIAAIACSSFLLVSCGSKVEGTYSDANGAFVLELRSGGEANFTFAGETAACTYTVDADKLTLSCKGDAGTIVLTIHDDGSLTGPPGSFMPALRRSKS